MELDTALRLVETRMGVLARAWGIKADALQRVKETQTRALSLAIIAVMKFPEQQAELVDFGARSVLAAAGYRPPQPMQRAG